MNKEHPTPIAVRKTVVILGLIVGSLDILAAIIDYYLSTQKNPVVIFKFIASGVLGQSAFSGGTGIILLGLLLHYIIAFLFTIFFVWLFIKTNLSSKNKLLTGILYGIFIWFVMSQIVLPISSTPKLPFHYLKALKAMLILICMIGLPLAFLTGKFIKKA